MLQHIELEIDFLRCFIEVAQTASFTKAGRNIGLTQSGVSVKIRRLEQRLGSQVLNRAGKILRLTLEGEILFHYAVRILATHDEVVSKLTKPKASGKLRIGLTDYFMPEISPKLLGKFKKEYPNVHLEAQIDGGVNLIPKFEKGEEHA